MTGGSIRVSLLMVLLLCISICGEVHAKEWIPLTGAVHVHSSEFSSGSHTLHELADMARAAEVDVVVLNDHEQIAMSYGIPPFRNLFSLTLSRNSVLKRGAKEYLEAVQKTDAENPDLLLIPGLETAPFHYWKGSLKEGTLTAHDWRKHIHVIGLTEPKDIENLPIPGNRLTTRYFFSLLPGFLVYAGLLLLSISMIRWGGFYSKAGKVLLIVGILGAFDAHPFKSTPFDPYHGEQGAAPYQELIDYVEEKGGMTFWAHPEAHFGAKELGAKKTIAGISLPGVYMKTDVHPNDLVLTRNYTGFESLYGDTIHATDTGREWDRVLIEYCNGTRLKPAWGFCGMDFHKLGQNSWSRLDRGQTVFWVREKTTKAVLEAMRKGRMYAAYQKGGGKIRLDSFYLSSREDGENAVSGETINTGGEPIKIVLELSLSGASPSPVKIDLIDSGKVLATLEENVPMTVTREFLPGRSKGYIRAMVRSKNYRVVTNPIFYIDPTK